MCFVTLVLTPALVGCAGGQRSGQTASGDYIELFKSGKYAQAYEVAAAEAQRARGYDADRASLYAGMSAHALDRNDDARRWLRPIITSGDREIAGNASASLGLIAQETNEHASAVELLTTASEKLTGDESARSLMYAGDSMQRLGKRQEAQNAWEEARERVVSDVGLRVMLGDRLAGQGPGVNGPTGGRVSTVTASPIGSGGFSVQAGAFSNRRTADSTASRLGKIAPARVVTITSSKGQVLHAVRLGRYTSRAEADQVRVRVGKDARVVAAE
jgi:tetratricopeptide (TPR) repeat protein